MKKKIIFIHYGGGIGGAPISMLSLVLSLDKNKYDIIIIFTKYGPIVDLAIKKGINTKVLPLKSAFFYSEHVKISIRMLIKYLINYYSTLKNTIKLIKEEKPDLVYLNTIVLIPVAIGVKNTKIPLLWHIREVPGPINLIRNWQLKKIKKMADKIIVTSNYVKSFFGDTYKIKTIHNAVDLNRFDIDPKKSRFNIRKEFGIREDSKVICMIGSIQKEKGHYILVESAKEIIKDYNNIKFLIVAGGVSEKYAHSWKGKIKKALGIPFGNLERMTNQILKNNLEKYFIFTGYRDDIPEILSASDIVVFLSQKAEGFGRPIIEGMASGKPIVVTDIGPSRELLGKGCGILVKVNDIESIKNSIIKLIDNPKLCIKMGMQGRHRVEKKFDLQRHVKSVEKCIDETLN